MSRISNQASAPHISDAECICACNSTTREALKNRS
jgi:hypothetical protein